MTLNRARRSAIPESIRPDSGPICAGLRPAEDICDLAGPLPGQATRESDASPEPPRCTGQRGIQRAERHETPGCGQVADPGLAERRQVIELTRAG